MARSRIKILVGNSIEACLAAIEIYNKPNFQYREECFSILMLNAWELLLKGRILQQNNGSVNSIEVFEPLKKVDGTRSKRKRKKLNRSGNSMTISLERAVEIVRNYGTNALDKRCIENLNLLKEIRDNSIHYYNVSAGLGKRIQEVGSAALKNFVSASENWFDVDLSHYNFYLMPLAFHSQTEIVESFKSEKNPQTVRRLLERISDVERDNPSDASEEFHVTLRVELKFSRASGEDVAPVRVAPSDPNAVPMTISEEDVRKGFPWEYSELTSQMKLRYSDFFQNKRYHKIRKSIENEGKYCKVRYLDPSKKKKTMKKTFYSPGIFKEFDQHYTRK